MQIKVKQYSICALIRHERNQLYFVYFIWLALQKIFFVKNMNVAKFVDKRRFSKSQNVIHGEQ